MPLPMPFRSGDLVVVVAQSLIHIGLCRLAL